MPNRSKVSKQITRRTGGYNKTGKGTTVAAINRMRDEWEDDPDFKGTPTPYNIRKKVRKKKKKAKSPNPMGIRITPKKTKRAGTNVVGADTRPKPRRGRKRQPNEGGAAIGSFTRKVAPDLSFVNLPPAKPKRTKPLDTISSSGTDSPYTEKRPKERTTPSAPPVHMRDPIEPEIIAKRKEVLAERAAERAARIEEGKRKAEAAALARENERKTNWRQLTAEAEERRLIAAQQQDRRNKTAKREETRRAKKRGPARMDLTDNRTEAQKEADRKIAERKRQRERGEYSEYYKGGKLTKKKTKAKTKPYKKTKKTYGGHHGSKLVASLYDQEDTMGPHTILKSPADLEKVCG